MNTEQNIVTVPFGKTKDGKDILMFRIPNNTDDYIEVLNYGCRIKSIFVHDNKNNLRNILCGYETIGEYENDGSAAGAVVAGAATTELCACSANKLWDVKEIGPNYVFLSCELTEEESGAGCKLTIGAKVMWVNLNRIVLDIYVTPEKDASVNFACNFSFKLAENLPASSYMLRSFCKGQCIAEKKVPTENTDYANLSFIPLGNDKQRFYTDADDVKPMAELANSKAGLTISAYGNLGIISCAQNSNLSGVDFSQTMERGIMLKAGETLSGRIIYGFDRLRNPNENTESAPNIFDEFLSPSKH